MTSICEHAARGQPARCFPKQDKADIVKRKVAHSCQQGHCARHKGKLDRFFNGIWAMLETGRLERQDTSTGWSKALLADEA